MKQKQFIPLYALILASTLFAVLAQAAGGLDTTFGTNGIVTTSVSPFTNYVNALVVQGDGKIVAVGSSGGMMGVVRYNANGTPDTAFNTTVASVAFPGEALGVALQPDGKIVVVGNNANPANVDIRVCRFNTNGTLDTTFDGDGIADTPIGSSTDAAFAVQIQPDGKILVSGRSDSEPVFVNSFAIVRYNANGSLDTTFDNDGIVIVLGPGNAITDSIALQSDGKIVVAHNYYTGSAYALTVLRFEANGSPDPTFDTDGRVLTTVGTNVEQAYVAIQKDGKIVVACSSFTSNAAGYDFWVVRYNSDGSTDGGFGNGGMVVTPIGAGAAFDMPRSIAIQANGKIVVGGKSPTGSNSDFAAVRYNRNGSLDMKWGAGGIVRTDLGGTSESMNAVAIQTNGRIIGGGESDVGSPGTRKFALARYAGDTAENADFDRDGETDISVYRPSEGIWYVLGSSTGTISGVKWGVSTDELAAADYDGDLKTDFAVWRSGAAASLWILNSLDNTVRFEQFGQTGDDPTVIADYDADGKADPAVYRAGAAGQQSYFYYRGSLNNPAGSTTFVPFGSSGDVAARGDYNGDGRFDPTVFRPAEGNWYSLNLANSATTVVHWGIATDTLVPADYTGDGKTDCAVFRNGTWFIRQSEDGLPQYLSWGIPSDIAIPSDYDGDGRADVAVYRNGVWHIQQTTSGYRMVAFGLSTDIPTPLAYLP